MLQGIYVLSAIIKLIVITVVIICIFAATAIVIVIFLVYCCLCNISKCLTLSAEVGERERCVCV